jgi:hypothetical protein
VESVAILGVICTQLISFYPRTESFTRSCLGTDPTTIVDSQGTTCAEVFATAAAGDLGVTLLMAALNITVLTGIVGITMRLWRWRSPSRAPPAAWAGSSCASLASLGARTRPMSGMSTKRFN